MDRHTGNTAIVDYETPKDEEEPIEIGKDDLQYVRDVRLRVVSEDGKPLESAIVRITDGENTEMRALVTPADKGVAVFQDVAAGEIGVKVEANGLKRTVDSDIELPEKRATPGFERDIKVRGDVDTLQAASTVPAGRAVATRPAPAPSGGSMLLQTLAGIMFLVVVIAVVWVVVKSRGISAEMALRKMGVQLPQDQAAEGTGVPQPIDPAVDPNVCEFCGQRKDASGRCACTVTPGASPFAASPAPGAGVPRLVGTQGTYSGQIFELVSESAVMGREAGNDIALVNDQTASRRHATITKSNGEFHIRDEGSSNGTFVNGAKITEQKLTSGDEIQVGGTKFRFEV